jgi:hypothetical protein
MKPRNAIQSKEGRRGTAEAALFNGKNHLMKSHILLIIVICSIFSCTPGKNESFSFDLKDFDTRVLQVNYIMREPLRYKNTFFINDTLLVEDIFKQLCTYSEKDYVSFIPGNYTARVYETIINQKNNKLFQLRTGFILLEGEEKEIGYVDIYLRTKYGYKRQGTLYDDKIPAMIENKNPFYGNESN